MSKKTMTIALSEPMLKALDSLKENGIVYSRSEAIRQAMYRFFKRENLTLHLFKFPIERLELK